MLIFVLYYFTFTLGIFYLLMQMVSFPFFAFCLFMGNTHCERVMSKNVIDCYIPVNEGNFHFYYVLAKI